MPPSVLIVVEGMLATAGAVPGEYPLKTDTMLCAVAKALAKQTLHVAGTGADVRIVDHERRKGPDGRDGG